MDTVEASAGLSRRAAARRRPAHGRRRLARPLIVLAALAAITLGAELVVRLAHVPTYVFPPPSAVLAELAAEPGLFLHNALVTVYEAAAGLALGAAVALAFAAGALRSRRLDAVLTPLVVASQTVPVIALAPLLVLWLGYGALPRVIVCALIAFFPMAVTALRGAARHRPAAAPAAAFRGRPAPRRVLARPHARPPLRSSPPACARGSRSASWARSSPSGPAPMAASATSSSAPTRAWRRRRPSPPSC